MIDSVPWFVGGGAEHSPETARNLAWHATEGATGITDSGDFRVVATPTPSEFVQILPGGGSMLSRYAGASQQSYTCRASSSTNVEIPATGSSGGQTRYVIIRVSDPQYAGAVPANVQSGPYVYPAVVSSITNLPYPFIELAKIVQPANTATITQAMITDIRKMARIRDKREVEVGYSALSELKGSNPDPWTTFTPLIPVPEWATHVTGIARVNSALIMTGGTNGNIYVELGSLRSGPGAFDFNQAGSNADGMRVGTLTAAVNAKLAAGMAGTSQRARILAHRFSGNGYLRADSVTLVEYDFTFERRPV